jgi:hypothetical protein
MTRPTKTLRTPIALAAVSILLAACSETAANDDNETVADAPSSDTSRAEEATPPAEESSSPAEETTIPAVQFALPNGVLPLPPPDDEGEAPPLEAGRYQVALNDALALEIDLPQGTYAHSEGLYLQMEDGTILKVEHAGEEYGVPIHPCTDQFPAPVGPTVRDLVDAIRAEPLYRVSAPEPAGIGSAESTHLEIRIPAGYNSDACHGSEVGMPGNPSTSNNMAPGYLGDWWILDVEGERVVVQRFCDGCATGAADRAATSVRNITFSPAS